jgi:VWFA-related protein
VTHFAPLGGDRADASSPEADAEQAAAAGTEALERRKLVVFIDLDSGLLPTRNRILDEVSSYLSSHATDLSTMVVSYGRSGLAVDQPFSSSPAEWSRAIAAAKEMPSRGVQRHQEQQRMVDNIRQIQQKAEHADPAGTRQARQQLGELMGSVRVQAETTRLDAMATLRAMETLVSVLSTVPGPKSLLYVGDGFPMRPGEDLYNLLADVFENDQRFAAQPGGSSNSGSSSSPSAPGGGSSAGGQRAGIAESSDLGVMSESTSMLRAQSMNHDLGPDLRSLTATANIHRVTLYGVSSDSRQLTARADSNLGSNVPGNAAAAYDSTRSQLREESLMRMTDDTGGLSLGPDAAVDRFLDKVFADEGSRYSIAYPSPHGGDSKYHRIKVKLARKDLELRFREGYIDRPRNVTPGDLVAGALLLGGGDNPHHFDLELVSQEPAPNDQMTVTMKLLIPIDELQLAAAGGQHESKLDLYVLSQGAKGAIAPMRTLSFTAALTPEQLAVAKGKLYGATLPLVLDKGPQTLAIGLVEPAAQRTSVARAELDVGSAMPVTLDAGGAPPPRPANGPAPAAPAAPAKPAGTPTPRPIS